MKRSSTPIVLMTLIAAGCGGGGGGSTPVVSPPASLMITGSNGQAAVKWSYEAGMQSASSAGYAGGAGLTATGGGNVATSAPTSKSVGGAIARIPFGPQTLPCDVSGSITLSGDLSNPLTLSAGDRFSIDASNCDDGLGEVTNGALDLTIDVLDGDFLGGLYDMSMSMDIMNFQVTTAADTVLSNGDSTVTLNTLMTPFVSASVSGASLATSSNSSAETLTNYAAQQTLDGGVTPSPYTFDASGTLDSSQLDGVVDYETPVTFQGFDAGYPESGQLLVTGAGNTSARLIAVDSVNVTIEIDSNGDGVVDEVINTTWVDLLS